VQEALANVQKHAQARRARVCFAREGEHIVVTISDDGAGFAPEQAALQGGRHFGLRMMHDRAAEIGGTLQVQSAPGRGAQVEVRVPVTYRKQEKEHPA
jgi:signal transduction histidine kinase